jgi:hypothetical protein
MAQSNTQKIKNAPKKIKYKKLKKKINSKFNKISLKARIKPKTSAKNDK